MNFNEYKLNEFCEFKYGKMPNKKKINVNGKYPIFSGYRVTGYYDEFNLEKGELIIVARGVGGTGDVKISEEKCYLTNLSIILQADEKVALKKYLYYYFMLNNLRYLDSGSAQSQITINDLKSVVVTLPTIKSQHRIVNILNIIDQKIIINSKLSDNLQQITEVIFKSWFIDFEPFKDQEFCESNLGNIPIGWRVSTLGEVTVMSAGGDKPEIISKELSEDCTVPVFSNGIENEGLFGYTNTAKIYDESVTVSARGTIGFVSLRQSPYVPIVRLVTLIPHRNVISSKYLYLFLKLSNISGTGTTQQQLTIPDFKKTKILIPNYCIMKKFTDAVDPIYLKIMTNKIETENLVKLRNSLLPKFMTGEIDLDDFELDI